MIGFRQPSFQLDFFKALFWYLSRAFALQFEFLSAQNLHASWASGQACLDVSGIDRTSHSDIGIRSNWIRGVASDAFGKSLVISVDKNVTL